MKYKLIFASLIFIGGNLKAQAPTGAAAATYAPSLANSPAPQMRGHAQIN
jgi:hypothetical protein